MNTEYVPAAYAETNDSQQAERFGVFDSKGRELGALANIGTCTITQIERSGSGMCSLPERLGHWFTFYPGATRNGKGFGASQGCRMFRTEAERDAALVKYFTDARKRALKNKAVVS